ncbi:molybdopterin-guanine dinucleotide biosynthesis protein B [Paramaledivibacter caminithermalis]|uniref:Molybdopterin-guanine dinucleotide biosynthesis protein B n=1 Tax=Paramaledivibacter caminithermalis (strain DSM 15212 / CIP 107654 / DViRD3) TaxID=1121301 RepID=A0A1M6QSU5_PARC5|nr:molybdopterin-guanine dinucleotide biosynthesis protein B [Paramaledivibacter caminithermalis]SHK23276.1 molybdopterin-guanine dinucleotide biosynthesis protein B [Paramaledivibacter caminithermalis DSM 15212]
MKVFSVFGYTGSGKTTTIENIIKELKKRRYSVGSVKEIHYEDFAIDTVGTNTHRHKMAGSELVTARGYYETDILFPEKISMEKLLSFYDQDYVVLEGVTDYNLPKILSAKNIEEIEERIDESVFAISGRISNEIDSYKGIPVINSMDNIDKLVDMIEEKVFDKLPDFDANCCTACGYDCRTLGIKILKGEAKRGDCILSQSKVRLFIDDRKIDMVPFVQKILYNAIHGVVSELEGYKKDAKIKIEIGNEDE